MLDGREEDAQSAFARNWFNCERQIRNAIVQQRAVRLGVEANKYRQEHVGFRMDLESVVTEAFARGNPLERELSLDRCRWNLAEESAAGDMFGLPALLAYGVKLRMIERWRPLTPEKGFERLEEMLGIVGVSSEEAAGWGGLAQM